MSNGYRWTLCLAVAGLSFGVCGAITAAAQTAPRRESAPDAARSEARPAAAPEKPAPADPVRAPRRPDTRPVPPMSAVPPDAHMWPGRYSGPGGPAVRAVAPEDVAQQVTCVLQIDADAALNPFNGGSNAIDARTAASVIRSTPVLRAAVKRAFGENGAPEGRLQDWLVVNAVQTGQRFLELEITLLKGDPKNETDQGRAPKLLAALRDSLEAALRESTEGQRAQSLRRREKTEQELAAARQRLDEVRAKLRKYRAETAGVQHGGDLRYAGQNLRSQRQQFEQQLAGYRSRLKAIEPSSSPLVAEWRGVVDLRQKQLDELKEQASSGRATAEQITAQERRVAEAKAQLEAYRRTGAAEAESNRGRVGEVASLESNIANTEANLKPILEQLAKLEDPKVLEMAEELPELQNEENRIRNEVNELVGRADQLRRTTDSGGEITLRVLDGQPDEPSPAPR